MVGDVQLAQGDIAGALKSYHDNLAIIDRLTSIQSRQHPMAARSGGGVEQGRRRAGGARRPCRCARSPTARTSLSWTGWRRSNPDNAVGSVVYRRFVQQDRRRADGAGRPCGRDESYRESLAIIDRLATSDLSNTTWQRDMSVSYDKIGDVQMAQGDLAGALASYGDSVNVRKKLTISDPSNADWQGELATSYAPVGDLQKEQDNTLLARSRPTATAWPSSTG